MQNITLDTFDETQNHLLILSGLINQYLLYLFHIFLCFINFFFVELPCHRVEFSQVEIKNDCVFMFGGYNESLLSSYNQESNTICLFSYFNDCFIYQSDIQTWLMIQPDGNFIKILVFFF